MRYSDGRVQINNITHVSVRAGISRICQRSPNKTEIPKAVITQIVAIFLADSRIAPDFCQSLIGGPSFGWLTSQSCARCDERAKQNADNNKNGTVGNKGNAIPSIARATVKQPQINQIDFISGTYGRTVIKPTSLLTKCSK